MARITTWSAELGAWFGQPTVLARPKTATRGTKLDLAGMGSETHLRHARNERGAAQGRLSGLSRRSVFAFRRRNIASRLQHVCRCYAVHVANAAIQPRFMPSNLNRLFAGWCRKHLGERPCRHFTASAPVSATGSHCTCTTAFVVVNARRAQHGGSARDLLRSRWSIPGRPNLHQVG